MSFRINEDIELVQELLSLSQRELARQLEVSTMTLNRWASGSNEPGRKSLEKFYAFAFSKGLRLNQIKAQLYQEDYRSRSQHVLFHGSKKGIDGPLSLTPSRTVNDFGKGFYCGESLEQSALFVARFPQSSVYAFLFDDTNLKGVQFQVDQEWMLAIALHRGLIHGYADHPLVQQVADKIERSDYVVAPIADNRMFQIIDSFIDGEITDEQCKHCLAATQLGNQYVFTTPEALSRLALLEQCYLCEPERDHYLERQNSEAKVSADKVKVARKTYRGEGRYIEEILS